MGAPVISIQGTVGNTGAPTPWMPSQRQQNVRGGRVNAPASNTDFLLFLQLPAGSDSPTEPLTIGQAGVRAIPPGGWLQGTDLDTDSQGYLQGNSAGTGYWCEDLPGFAPAGIQAGFYAQEMTAADGGLVTIGAKSDAAATDSTSAWSLVAILKGILAKLLGTLSVIGTQLTIYNNLGSIADGEIASGAKKIKWIVGQNGTASLMYLHLFDINGAPAGGSTPTLCIPVGIGITTSLTTAGEDYRPDYVQFESGIYYGWSSTEATYTPITPTTQQVKVAYQ